MIKPFRWWAEHPWKVWWLSLGLIFLLGLLHQILSRWDLGYLLDPVFPVALAAALVVWLACYVRAAQQAWRRSKTISALVTGLGRLLLLFVVVTIPLIPEIFAIHPKPPRSWRIKSHLRSVASALTVYHAHCGNLPRGAEVKFNSATGPGGTGDCSPDNPLGALLAEQTNPRGERLVALLERFPDPPGGCSKHYTYTSPGGSTPDDPPFILHHAPTALCDDITVPERESR